MAGSAVLPVPYGAKVASLRALIAVLDGQVTALGAEAAAMLAAEPGYAALRAARMARCWPR